TNARAKDVLHRPKPTAHGTEEERVAVFANTIRGSPRFQWGIGRPSVQIEIAVPPHIDSRYFGTELLEVEGEPTGSRPDIEHPQTLHRFGEAVHGDVGADVVVSANCKPVIEIIAVVPPIELTAPRVEFIYANRPGEARQMTRGRYAHNAFGDPT